MNAGGWVPKSGGGSCVCGGDMCEGKQMEKGGGHQERWEGFVVMCVTMRCSGSSNLKRCNKTSRKPCQN